MPGRNQRQKSLYDIVVDKCLKKPLFIERKYQAKTLQDLAIDYCARNLEEVFTTKRHANRDLELTLKEGIRLPPILFEKIQERGVEMALPMPPKAVKACLRQRDSLYWQNVNVYSMRCDHDRLSDRDLGRIARAVLPVKRLSFSPDGVLSEEAVLHLSRMAPTLEQLEIGGRKYNMQPLPRHMSDISGQLLQERIRFLRLRHLTLNFRKIRPSFLALIDLGSLSATLETLSVYNLEEEEFQSRQPYSIILTHLIRGCKNLRNLTLRRCPFNKEATLSLLSAIKTSSELRSLDLYGFAMPLGLDQCHAELSDLLNHLPKLEDLELGRSEFWLLTRRLAKNMHLRYLGYWVVSTDGDLPIRADVLSREDNMETMFDAREVQDFVGCYLESLALFAGYEFLTGERLAKLEKILRRALDVQPLLCRTILYYVKRDNWRHRFSPRFVADLIRARVGFTKYYQLHFGHFRH